MGTYQSGPFGPFRGKVGYVVAVKWKGVNVVRNYPQKSTKVPAVALAQHRDKFAYTMKFVGQALGLIYIGHGHVSGRTNPENIAFKSILAHAVKGIHPDYELDTEQVKLSTWSKMDAVMQPKVSLVADQMVQVSWKMDERANRYTSPVDLAYILLYNPSKEASVVSCGLVKREALSAELNVPDSFEGDVLHCWMFFASENGKFVSETSNVGELKC
ncbi:DUF6266 family protein [Pedobacter gandavensis]|uniref:DUF6266 family protein n=1 Tax=Pedobacter gandavensis TaxID=2679963 RepID=UPI002931C512|nr:DUF6266 family protein [Pedobacter gandavensis]